MSEFSRQSEFGRQSEYQASIVTHDHTTTNAPFIGAHDHTTANVPPVATHAPDYRGFTFIGAKERITSDGRRIMDMPATKELFKPANAPVTSRLRVAAYARVSTDDEEQQTSYAAQVDHYMRFITSNPEWEFSGMYTDEGISATSTAKRDGFKRMIQDALDGKFDRILTKSVSRFARNTVDSLTTIRSLKAKGVGVTFEKENIDTLDSKGELLITLMSSLAQEESRSISENTTWGQRKRFADGKVTMPFSHFLGYDRGDDGEPVINEEEAQIARLIYKRFLDGASISAIARYLTKQGVPSPGGGKKWQSTTIESILTNEKYRGDALLQKSFTVDFLTKKMKRNEGEVQSYYVENSHPAIVSGEVFELAQSELRRRRESGRRICSSHIFASKLVCGECGGVYGSKVWNSNSKYRKVIWQCNRKYGRYGRYGQYGANGANGGNRLDNGMGTGAVTVDEANKDGLFPVSTETAVSDAKTASHCSTPHQSGSKASRCSTPHLTDEQIKTAFITMMNDMIESKAEIIAFYDEILSPITDVAALKEQKARLESEALEIGNALHDWILESARRVMTKEVYNARYEALDGQLEALKISLQETNDEILQRTAKRVNAQSVMRVVKEIGPMTDFDEGIFGALVDTVTVYGDRLVFRLKDGSERAVGR